MYQSLFVLVIMLHRFLVFFFFNSSFPFFRLLPLLPLLFSSPLPSKDVSKAHYYRDGIFGLFLFLVFKLIHFCSLLSVLFWGGGGGR